jgi:hypothetical protein
MQLLSRGTGCLVIASPAKPGRAPVERLDGLPPLSPKLRRTSRVTRLLAGTLAMTV